MDDSAPLTGRLLLCRGAPRKRSTPFLKPWVERVEERLLLSTFKVTNTNDDTNMGSLRWAIGQSNATPGSNTIDFSIALAGVQTINLTSSLPAITVPVTIDGTSEPGYTTSPLVELNGAGAGKGVDGLDISAGGTTVKGLVINRFTGEGISLSMAGSDSIQSNFIGTDPTGKIAEGNGLDGVLVQVNSNSNTIQHNLISGNTHNGIYLNGQLFGMAHPLTSGNLIAGNLIGTDVTGTKTLGNGSDGLQVLDAPLTTIGGTVSGARNIISGNKNGMELLGIVDGALDDTITQPDGSVIEGNYIGTDITGTVALGNGPSGAVLGDGIALRGISNSTIGGTASGAGNVISGNKNYGIDSFVIGSGNLAIQGNLIGTDATGTKPLGNGIVPMGIDSSGIDISGEANVTIGGTVAGAGNVISANGDNGINTFANGPGLTIQGNFIGTDITGTLPLGNGGDGINATYAGITIGGTMSGAANIIANNGATATFDHSGVVVTAASTSILSNSIYNNHKLGIELNVSGNNMQVAPVLTSAASMITSSTITGALTAAAGTYTLQFFSTPGLNPSNNAEGETLIGTATLTVTGGLTNFSEVLPSGFTPGSLITATATNSVGSTSEFSVARHRDGDGQSVRGAYDQRRVRAFNRRRRPGHDRHVHDHQHKRGHRHWLGLPRHHSGRHHVHLWRDLVGSFRDVRERCGHGESWNSRRGPVGGRVDPAGDHGGGRAVVHRSRQRLDDDPVGPVGDRHGLGHHHGHLSSEPRVRAADDPR